MLGGQSTGLDRPLEGLVVGFRLVGVGAREAGESSVRDVAFAEVAREHGGTRRASVAFGEKGAANPAIVHQR
jgi:hypothetical protein